MSGNSKIQGSKNRVDIFSQGRNNRRRCKVLVSRVKRNEGGNIMRIAMSVVAFVTSLSLAACQTASINGVPVHLAQGGDTFCERNFLLCIAGGALVAGGAAAAASGGHHGDPPSGNTGGSGSTSGSSNRNRAAIP